MRSVVAAKSLNVPAPGIRYDRCEIGSLWGPAENGAGLGRVGNQYRRVPWPPWRVPHSNLTASDLLNHVDDLTHRTALTGTQIDRDRFTALQQVIDGKRVRVPQITNMDIITHGRAIWSGIINTEHSNICSLAASRIKHKRNKMGLGMVILTNFSRRLSTGSVEIAQPYGCQSISAAKIIHHSLAN